MVPEEFNGFGGGGVRNLWGRGDWRLIWRVGGILFVKKVFPFKKFWFIGNHRIQVSQKFNLP